MDINSTANIYKKANFLALVTIAYNLVEGLASIGLGAADETLALFGFGVDSFIEVIWGIGVWHMLRRIRVKGEEIGDRFEQRALKITCSLHALAVGLIASPQLEYSARAPTGNHFLGNYHIRCLHLIHVAFNPSENEGWQGTFITCHPCRRRLLQSLSLSVPGADVRQYRLRTHRHRQS